MNDRDILHQQLVNLGDMMGDGLHLEKDGRWITREYRRISKILFPEMSPKRDTTLRDSAIAECVKTIRARSAGESSSKLVKVRCELYALNAALKDN